MTRLFSYMYSTYIEHVSQHSPLPPQILVFMRPIHIFHSFFMRSLQVKAVTPFICSLLVLELGFEILNSHHSLKEYLCFT